MQPIVLLADDEASFLISARAILQNAGYAVTAIQSGDEVRAALADHSYDILLLDFQMPGNENLQLLRYLRDTDCRIPIILMTGFPTFPSAIEALRLRVFDYITKPFDVDEFLERVAAGIESGRVPS